jgi:hypothetical protein
LKCEKHLIYGKKKECNIFQKRATKKLTKK